MSSPHRMLCPVSGKAAYSTRSEVHSLYKQVIFKLCHDSRSINLSFRKGQMHECESVAVENVESEEMATEGQSSGSVKCTVLTMVFTFWKYMSSLEGNHHRNTVSRCYVSEEISHVID